MPGQPINDLLAARAFPHFRDGTEACKGTDPEIFYPERMTYEAVQPAIRLCKKCPLRQACLDWALETGQNFGIWGAHTPQRRRRILTGNGARR